MRHGALFGVVVAALVCCGGCSILSTPGPRVVRAGTGTRMACDATYVAPVLDAAITIAGAALAVWGATASEDPEGHVVTGRNFAFVPGALIAGAFGISAAYGFPKVAACKRAAAGQSPLVVGSRK